jgi:secondary thiamine-phosphate synthase enzyme
MSSFRVFNKTLHFSTKGAIDFVDLTCEVQDAVVQSHVKNGLVHVFAPHATGIIILTENEPSLLRDISNFIRQLVPEGKTYSHPSNAHAHLRSVLLPPDRTIPVVNGQPAFGTWQSVLFVETDVYPRNRLVMIQVFGEESS